MNIATALNKKYLKYLLVMMNSLGKNTHEHIDMFLLHSELEEADFDIIRNAMKQYDVAVHSVQVDRTRFCDKLPVTSAWSLETYFRLMLLDLLPDETDRLLYLDVDIIVCDSIKELYEMHFEDKLFVACHDAGENDFPSGDLRNELFKKYKERDDFKYFNAGVMLWNIEKLRAEGYCFEKYMLLAESLDYRLLAPDQDLLNYMHIGQVKYVESMKYDFFAKFYYYRGITLAEMPKDTAIIHFTGTKPWEGEQIHFDIEKIWWDYAKDTPFYQELLEDFQKACIESNTIFQMVENLTLEKRELYDLILKFQAYLKTNQ